MGDSLASGVVVRKLKTSLPNSQALPRNDPQISPITQISQTRCSRAAKDQLQSGKTYGRMSRNRN